MALCNNTRKVLSVDDLDPSVFKKQLINASNPETSAWIITVELSAVNLIENDPVFSTWAQTYSANYQNAFEAFENGIAPQELVYDSQTGDLSLTGGGNTVNIGILPSPESFLPDEYIFFKTSLNGNITINPGLPLREFYSFSYFNTSGTLVVSTTSNATTTISSNNYAPKDITLWRSNSTGFSNGLSFNTFSCISAGIVSIDTTKISDLRSLNLKGNLLDSFYLDFNAPTLTSLDLSNNRISSVGERLNNLTNLVNLNIANNQISSLNLNNVVGLQELFCQNNGLVDLNISGLRFGGSGLVCSGNNLNAITLNGIYTNIGTALVSGTIIDVRGNPGVASHNPSLATSKNYTVLSF